MRMTRHNQIIDSVFSDSLSGSSGADYFELTWGNDTAYGGKGDDVFWDLDGSYQNAYPGHQGDHIWLGSDDIIHGGEGNDLVFAGLGADQIHGGSGHDTLDYRYSAAAVELNLILGRGYGDGRSAATGDRFTGIESFRGSSHDDLFHLGADRVTISGDRGNDRFYGGSGVVTMYGGDGNDVFTLGSGAAEIHGGAGSDTVSLALLTTGRSLTLTADRSIEHVAGSNHADTISMGVDYLNSVTVRAGAGDDTVTISGTGTVIGGSGIAYGGAGNDSLNGGRNADSLYGEAGNDRISGGDGDDHLSGGAGNDSLFGGAGRDALFGGDGTDYLSGGTGAGDRLYGGAGADTLMLGRDATTMFGESGADTFVFSPGNGLVGNGVQRIADFQRGQDRIDVSQIDARVFEDRYDAAIAGHQDFVFAGRTGKSAPAGTIDYRHVGGDTVVSLHTDSDGIAEYQVTLSGLHNLTVTDFIL